MIRKHNFQSTPLVTLAVLLNLFYFQEVCSVNGQGLRGPAVARDHIDEWTNSVLGKEDIKTNNSSSGLTLNFCKCGRSNTANRIINGQEAAANAWPWMAALVYQEPQNGTLYNNLFQGFCGGSVINDRYVLTAAHCVEAMKKLNRSSLWVILGDNNINGVPSASRQVLAVTSFRSHPKYNFTTLEYDVGLIKVNTTIKLSKNVTPVCLGQGGSPFTGRTAVVAGWGLIQGGNPSTASSSLRQTTLQVQTQSFCNASYLNGSDADGTPYPKTVICASAPRTGACNGDSGGPLVVETSSSSQTYKQIGVVSFGNVDCPLDSPTFFARVQRMISWVKAFTKDATYCLNSFSQ